MPFLKKGKTFLFFILAKTERKCDFHLLLYKILFNLFIIQIFEFKSLLNLTFS